MPENDWNEAWLEDLTEKPPRLRGGPKERELGAWEKKYPRGQTFGPVTARRLGLTPGRGYTEEDLEGWFTKLRDFSAYLYNKPSLEKQIGAFIPRAAQLKMSPQSFGLLWERLGVQKETYRKQLAEWREKASEAAKSGFTLPFSEERAPTMPQWTPEVKYIFGQTDVAPEGYRSIPLGMSPIEIGGGQRQIPFLQPSAPTPAPRPAARQESFLRGGYPPPARWLLY